MTCGIAWVDRLLNKAFYKLGVRIAKTPGYYIIIPVLLSLLCITGFQQIKYEIDPEYLFSPINGEGKMERAVVEEFFKVNYTDYFSVQRITRAGRFGRVIIVSKDGDPNLMRRAVFDELIALDQIIQNTTVTYDGETFTYKDMCAKWEEKCFLNDILNLEKIIDDVEKGDFNLLWPITFNPETLDLHVFPVFFGGTKYNNESVIEMVPSLHLVYFVTVNTPRQDAMGAAWEETFLDRMGYLEDNNVFKHISIARFASRTLDIELEKNTKTVIPYFSSAFIMISVFSIVTCMMGDVVRSKPFLGLMGNISAILACLSAFGLAMYLGYEFIGLNLAAPFLMISIGIDDMFVMLAAWRRTSPKLAVPERMGHMMSEAAVSITITSLTDMVSFFIGVISPFQSVRIFCTYSGLAVIFLFVWCITFFAGCMAVSGYREEKNLHAIFYCKVKPESVAIKENRSWIYRKLWTGGVNQNDIDNPIDNKEHMLMAFFRDYVAAALNKSWVKTLIILIFGVYIAGACYGLTQIKEGLERRKLSKEGSYSIEFFDREDMYYREFPYRIQVIVSGDLNYSDPNTQAQIEDVMQQFENTTFIAAPLSESWLRRFLVEVAVREKDGEIDKIEDETDFVEALKDTILPQGLITTDSLDVKFNDAGDRIVAARFMIQAVNVTDTNEEMIMLRELRTIAKAAPINVTIFNPYFIYFDQFELVRPTALQAMIIGAIIMMIISFIFIPNILCSLWVAFSIVSIELGVAGYMSLWDVHLDSISMINLIMCIGFSVDFTAHICYTYMSAEGKTADERVKEALYSLGWPILQGSSSTILGCIALLIAQSYIFLVFFKMIFLVIVFGALHGLFLLPVLLSIFGPNSCAHQKCQGNESIELEAKKPKLYETPSPFYLPQITLSHAGKGASYLNAPYKIYGEEKDLGLGTSGEDSSESSSSRSQNKQNSEEEMTRRRYEEGWRRSSYSQECSTSQPSLYGYVCTDESWRDTIKPCDKEIPDKRSSRSQTPTLPKYYIESIDTNDTNNYKCNKTVDVRRYPAKSHGASIYPSSRNTSAPEPNSKHNLKHMGDIRRFP